MPRPPNSGYLYTHALYTGLAFRGAQEKQRKRKSVLIMDASTPADKFDFETSTVVMKTPGDAIPGGKK